jgi:hypothetical protein
MVEKTEAGIVWIRNLGKSHEEYVLHINMVSNIKKQIAKIVREIRICGDGCIIGIH